MLDVVARFRLRSRDRGI